MNYFIHLREKRIFKMNSIKIFDKFFQLDKIMKDQNFSIDNIPITTDLLGIGDIIVVEFYLLTLTITF